MVGSANMDLVVHAERLPARGETLLGGAFATFAGGGGFAAERVRGASIRGAIDFAQRAAALSVTREGAQASIPTQFEVRAQPTFAAAVS
ncbi:sugar/nucleoside kinase (ribokinase family) [Paraburkholderia sp. Clong3]